MENRFFTTQKKHRWLCTMLLLFMSILSATAGCDWYYYKTTVYAYPTTGTGGGKVYVDTKSTNDFTYQNSGYSIEGRQYNYGEGISTFYFYAKANDNYLFSHWVKGKSTTNGSGTSVSTDNPYSNEETYSGSSRNRTQISYTAIFVQQTGLIKARSADESKGSVTNSKPQNTEGQQVTLTANPDVSNGVMFLGWKKAPEGGTPQDGPNDGYLSKDRVLTLTANNETKGTYWAYFSDAADKVYVRMKNRKTGKFLSIYGTAEALPHTRTIGGDTHQDGYVFKNSLKMLSPDDAQGNPSTVFLRAGHPGSTGVTIGATISAHGVNYPDLLNNNPNNTGDDKVLTMEKRGDYYRIYTSFKYSNDGNNTTVSSYLCDEGTGDYPIMKTQATGEEADWLIYTLDEGTTEGAFGANAKAKYTKDGMYYTTMYTDFPYKLLDGVNAYYLYIKEELTHITDVVVFTPIKHGIVPAYTAVILECPEIQKEGSSTTVVNRLLPLVNDNSLVIDDEDKVNEGANFLKGYIYVEGRDTKVSNDKKLMYILGWHERLGFYHSSGANMTPNKAYLLAPDASEEETANFANTYTFSFGMPKEDDTPTKIVLSKQIVDDEDAPVFDLNGRKVAEGKDAEKLLREGIYVKKGKKFVVK